MHQLDLLFSRFYGENPRAQQQRQTHLITIQYLMEKIDRNAVKATKRWRKKNINTKNKTIKITFYFYYLHLAQLIASICFFFSQWRVSMHIYIGFGFNNSNVFHLTNESPTNDVKNLRAMSNLFIVYVSKQSTV